VPALHPHPEKETLGAREFVSLEALRGLLALYVVANHARGHAWSGLSYLGPAASEASILEKLGFAVNLLTRFGHEAVIAFFVLSGLSIAHSLRRGGRIRTFFVRRLIRLYPPKLAGLLWAMAVFVFLRSYFPPLFQQATQTWNLAKDGDFLDLRVVLSNLLYMPHGTMIAQYWSLPHEMLFYLLAPLLCARPALFLSASVAALLIYVGLTGPQGFLGEFALHYSFFFAVGVAFYRALPKTRLKLHRVVRSRGALAWLVAGLTLLLPAGWLHPILGEVFIALWTLAVILYLIEYPVTNRPLLALGEQSYSLYLSHFATVVLFVAVWHKVTGRTLPETNPFVWLLALVPCLLVSSVLFYLAERPSRHLLAWFRRGQAGRMRWVEQSGRR
jgi:peptidoglycan/LPS O-acetylase OafA/YrhL